MLEETHDLPNSKTHNHHASKVIDSSSAKEHVKPQDAFNEIKDAATEACYGDDAVATKVMAGSETASAHGSEVDANAEQKLSRKEAILNAEIAEPSFDMSKVGKLIGINHHVWSVWFFFFCVGFVYSQFTSRMPAVKQNLTTDEGGVGFLLMTFSAGSLIGLFSSGFILKYISSRLALRVSLFFFIIIAVAISTLHNYELALVGFFFWGLSCSFIDVCMNAQAMYLEHYSGRKYMASMHANYSVGCVVGSACASAFAFSGLSLFLNIASVSAIGLIMLFYFSRHLMPDINSTVNEDNTETTETTEKSKSIMSRIPFFVMLCGVMSLLSYTSEGSVAEWGGLVMTETKNASEGLAALAYGVLASVMALTRFSVDRLRGRIPDMALMMGGAIIAMISMIIVINTKDPVITLVAYGLLGFGLAPISPIAFSRAGTNGVVSPKLAATIVSIIGYMGFLVIPPTLGILANFFGLERALFMPLTGLVLVLGLAYFFKTHKHATN